MKYSDIQIQLQSVTYSSAIDRYNYLKMRFFNEYSIVANMEEQAIIQQFENEIVNEVNANPVGEQQKQAEELFQWVQQVIFERLKGNKEAIEKRKQFQQRAKEVKTKGDLELNKLANDILSEQEMADFVKKQLVSAGVGASFTIEDILNQVRNYRNKVLATRTNASAKRYITSTKGYYREALIYKAFSRLGEHLDNLPVIPTGSLKDEKGRSTLYDTYINFLQNVSQGFSMLITENVDAGYGLQSKSWTAPWEGSNFFGEKYGYSIGSRSELLAQSGLKGMPNTIWHWVKGVQFLEKNAIKAIGENQLGFITGNNFYWTADLITYFRAMNYFLAFGYSKEKTFTPTVSWQQMSFS